MSDVEYESPERIGNAPGVWPQGFESLTLSPASKILRKVVLVDTEDIEPQIRFVQGFAVAQSEEIVADCVDGVQEGVSVRVHNLR